jgi:thiol-disulfide isomerase/thioredoxin
VLRAGAILGVPVLVGVLTFGALALFADDGRLRGGADDLAVGAAAEPVAVSPEDAPEVSGEDPITGEDVALDDFRGKPVVINIWASWCPGCNEEAADLREFAADHPEAVLLGVDFQTRLAGRESSMSAGAGSTRASSTPRARRRRSSGSSVCRRPSSSTRAIGSRLG